MQSIKNYILDKLKDKTNEELQRAYKDVKRLSEEYLFQKRYTDLYLQEINELEEKVEELNDIIDIKNQEIDDLHLDISYLKDEIDDLMHDEEVICHCGKTHE